MIENKNVKVRFFKKIFQGFKDAFYKYTFDEADTQGFPYDLTSIMHYENGAFSGGYCKPTMLVKANYSYEVRPVFKRKFSPQDVKKINKLYGCQTNELPPVGKYCRLTFCLFPPGQIWSAKAN